MKPTDMNQDLGSSSPRAVSASSLQRVAAGWLLVALIALVAMYARLRNISFDGDFQGWASASCMTMAQAFNHLGALHTHFVPIQNNLPLGSDPDVYLHWPPLYPLLLSFVLRLFGDQESSGRLFAMVITLATTVVVVLIARRLFGIRAAMLAGFFFLTVRATYEGGRAVLHQPLATLFGVATVLCFLLATTIPLQHSVKSTHTRLWFLLGLLCTICTLLTAWDPVFIPLGLLLAALYLRLREAIRIAAVYLFAGTLTFLAVQTDYIFSYPSLFKNQLATIAYRAGLTFNGDSSVRLHTIVDNVHYSWHLSFFGTYSHVLRFVDHYFNDLTLLAVPIFLAYLFQTGRHREAPQIYLFGGLCFPALLWFALMRNYISIHPFALVLIAPFVAIASGFVLDRLWTFLNERERYPLLWVTMYFLPALILYPLVMYVVDARVPYEAAQFQSLSALIERNTPPNAVVLSPAESAVPIYYSNRHIVRGIQSEHWLSQAITQAHAAFPESPLFLALQDTDREDFPQSLPNRKPIAREGDSAIYLLSQ